MPHITRKGIQYKVVDRTDQHPPVKTCRRCGEEKLIDQFPKKNNWRRDTKVPTVYVNHASMCVACRAGYGKDYYEREKSTGKWNLYSRAKGLQRRYGITEEDYNTLLEVQGGKCAICGSTQGRMHAATGEPRHLAVDHDHETGEIRGLLCDGCNQGIGLLGDDPNRLADAAAYLMRAQLKKGVVV